MKNSFKEKWFKKSKDGFLRFLLIDGVIKFGIPIFTLIYVFNVISANSYLPYTHVSLLEKLFIVLVGSIVWSVLVWTISQRVFRK